jgi:hypothetical protein
MNGPPPKRFTANLTQSQILSLSFWDFLKWFVQLNLFRWAIVLVWHNQITLFCCCMQYMSVFVLFISYSLFAHLYLLCQ